MLWYQNLNLVFHYKRQYWTETTVTTVKYWLNVVETDLLTYLQLFHHQCYFIIIHGKLGLTNLYLSILHFWPYIFIASQSSHHILHNTLTICCTSLSFKQQHCTSSPHRHRDSHYSTTTHSSIRPSFHISSQTVLCLYVRGQSVWQSGNESRPLNELLISPFRHKTVSGLYSQ